LICHSSNLTYQKNLQKRCYTSAVVKVCEDLEGKITIIYKGEKLNYTCYKKQRKAEITGAKALNHKVDSIAKNRYKPNMDHPWRQYKIKYEPMGSAVSC